MYNTFITVKKKDLLLILHLKRFTYFKKIQPNGKKFDRIFS